MHKSHWRCFLALVILLFFVEGCGYTRSLAPTTRDEAQAPSSSNSKQMGRDGDGSRRSQRCMEIRRRTTRGLGATGEVQEGKRGGQSSPASAKVVRVIRVVDGDTILIERGHKVRYIGVNAPEVDGRVQPYGKEALEKNKEMVEGQLVRLEKDVSETDKYGRLLRYVYIDGLFVNAELVREGFAYARAYPPDMKYQDCLRDLQEEARQAGRGIWSR